MITKLIAAQIATEAGIDTIIINGFVQITFIRY